MPLICKLGVAQSDVCFALNVGWDLKCDACVSVGYRCHASVWRHLVFSVRVREEQKAVFKRNLQLHLHDFNSNRWVADGAAAAAADPRESPV